MDRHTYPWLSRDRTSLGKSYRLNDFLADTANQPPVKSVHVQGEIAREQSIDETAWLQTLASEHGFPHGIVAYAPLRDPSIDAMLDAQAKHANLRGIRQILNPDQCERADLLTDPTWQAGYARLARYGLSFDLQAPPSQMADAATIAHTHPDISMVVNHTGMPRDRSGFGRPRRAGPTWASSLCRAPVESRGWLISNSEHITPLSDLSLYIDI